VKTRGNTDVHIILRGGAHGPNYAPEHVAAAAAAVVKARAGAREGGASVMVDCSREFVLFCLQI
jgi:3-deoxy-7-phosphoheptulonate synthase